MSAATNRAGFVVACTLPAASGGSRLRPARSPSTDPRSGPHQLRRGEHGDQHAHQHRCAPDSLLRSARARLSWWRRSNLGSGGAEPADSLTGSVSNAGTMLVRNSEWSRQFFREWMEHPARNRYPLRTDWIACPRCRVSPHSLRRFAFALMQSFSGDIAQMPAGCGDWRARPVDVRFAVRSSQRPRLASKNRCVPGYGFRIDNSDLSEQRLTYLAVHKHEFIADLILFVTQPRRSTPSLRSMRRSGSPNSSRSCTSWVGLLGLMWPAECRVGTERSFGPLVSAGDLNAVRLAVFRSWLAGLCAHQAAAAGQPCGPRCGHSGACRLSTY